MCHNSYASGDAQTAEVEARYLNEECPTWPGPYRILSRILFEKGKVDDAIAVLLKGRIKTNGHKEIEMEVRELEEFKQGLRSTPRFEHFRIFSGPLTTAFHQQVVCSSLPEFRDQPEFFKQLVELACEMIYQIQKTPPGFLTAFRSGNGSLDEGDFRDELERTAAYQFKAMAGEAKHGKGYADLVIRNIKASLPEGVVFEFKVWSRNDYLFVVEQLLKYLTDFEPYGIIFMINSNKRSIAGKYRDEIIFQHSGYITGSFRSAPLRVPAISITSSAAIKTSMAGRYGSFILSLMCCDGTSWQHSRSLFGSHATFMRQGYVSFAPEAGSLLSPFEYTHLI